MKPFAVYYNETSSKVKSLSGKYEFSTEAWNAYHELLALRSFAADLQKNSHRKLYNKMYSNFVNSNKFGLALYVEHTLLRNKEVR